MFGVVVGVIVLTGTPIYVEVMLGYAIAYPIKSHVHGAGASLTDCVVCDSDGAEVIGLDGGCRLDMA